MKMKWMISILLMGSLLGISNAGGLEGLRGDLAIDEMNLEVDSFQVQEGIVIRKNYRQQPPLIPHKIEKYQINMKANQCLRCHSWPYNSDFKTVAAPESHFIGSQTETRTDHISADRWFCTQCHVPQSNAPELIDNTFTSSDGL